MVIISALPGGLFQYNFERYHPDKVGGAVPTRFISDKIEDSKPDGKAATVKIAISSTVTKSSNIFFNGNAEAAIALIQVQEFIVADKKLKIQFKANRVLQSAKKAKMRELDKKTDKEAIDKGVINSLALLVKIVLISAPFFLNNLIVSKLL